MTEHDASAIDPDRWVELYADYLYRFALARVREQDTARDLVQETLLAALKAKNAYRGGAAERTWLTGILKNKIVDFYRRGRRETPFTDLSRSESDDHALFDERGHWQSGPATPREWNDDQVRRMDRPEFWKRFEECAGQLPEQTRRVFVMREVDDFSTDEVCAALGITPQNYWTIMHRARAALRRCMEANWFAVN